MIPVLQQLRYHGFNYTQICRGTRSCLYRQTYQGKTVGFEVFIITHQPEILIKGIVYPARERWPKDEDFGKTAWSYWTLEERQIKFDQLGKHMVNINNSTRDLDRKSRFHKNRMAT